MRRFGFCLSLLLTFILLFCSGCSDSSSFESDYWVSECLVEHGGHRYEVLVNRNDRCTYLVTDDEVLLSRAMELYVQDRGTSDLSADEVSVLGEDVLLESPVEGMKMLLVYSYPREATARYSEPDFGSIEAANNLWLEEPNGFEYVVPFDTSLQYIDYLLESGYSVDASCVSSRCIEYFLVDGEGSRLRCVVFPDKLWCAELYESADAVSLYSFLSAWDFNGYLTDLLN